MIVDLRGGSDLLDKALVHDNDPVGQSHGLLLVMGHKHHRDIQFLLDPLQLLPHLGPDLGVQGRKGLVQEKD